ncbi:hypothetical protein BpHYR1_033743 [Brachionus plicatilis]|uniref:Transposase n=1 Tax=Brachionus plicatilis TaxID=10195 RepID=A0A3M7T246_BRAPC|nr:hypothetical protein BpHYR1_033743 [Brachionus plicatilis]
MCWAHVIRNLVQKFKNHEHFANFIKDIHHLQLSTSDKMFTQASHLFVKKWESETSAIKMVTYFKDTWLESSINGWFDGRAPGHPVTNNAIESYNNQLKDLCQRSELLLEEFFRELDGIFNRWSTKRSEAITDPKIFAHYPNVTLDDYT